MADNSMPTARVPQCLLIFLRNQSHLRLRNVTLAVAAQKSNKDEKVSLELVLLVVLLRSSSLSATGFVEWSVDLPSHLLRSPRPYPPHDVDYFTSQMWLLYLTSLTCWAADCLHFLGCHENMVLLFQRRRKKKKKTANDFSGNFKVVWEHYAACLCPNCDRSKNGIPERKSLILNSESTYSEMWNSEFPVPEHVFRISWINSEYVHFELSTCTTTRKSHHEWQQHALPRLNLKSVR